MQYTPKSASEIAAMKLKPEGNYAFELATAEDTVSKSSGKDMMKVLLNVYDAEGRIFQVTDYLVPGTNYGDRKVFEFASSVGLAGKYASGTMTAEDVLGKGGWCKIKVGKAQPNKDGSGEFPPRNEVAWYLDKAPANSSAPVKQNTPDTPTPTQDTKDEDCPF